MSPWLWLCRAGRHKRSVSRTRSIRYGVLVTYRCPRCDHEWTEAQR